MSKINKLGIAVAAVVGSLAFNAQAETVKVYNWSDYIAEDTIANFEAQTGLKVSYDVFDSNEVVEAKLLTGNTGFDVVVPSASFLGRQIQAGVFMKLDRSKIPNIKHLDPVLMKKLERVDPANAHAVPYLWGTTGIGYNVEKIAEIFGEDFQVDSWDLFFKPENISKLASCGVASLDAASEMIPAALHYLGLDPNTHNKADIEKAAELLKSVRPHIRYFHSSQYINDLANGDICLAIGWSGDVMQASDRAADAENGVTVDYSIPKEGAGMWFDMLAIPADTTNAAGAHQFINYILEPKVTASITDYVWYPNGNKAATPLIDPEITAAENIYPPVEVMNKLYTFDVMPAKVSRITNRAWSDIKAGK
ncbi:polyamine ABC transporter substrate-binding protein [Paraferrimonas sp. SM1919]|uniref:polyamine ABC transporter substrate-binding protein n=1 Tax=Paraferrimonas sp. SM1919 TaxID=2662263 RepID=UPI0013D5AB85|nr:polyamine ABC transporter substrate-binding protein [Paraferrimonas sp. SM1919]